jgi:HK97 gp10 family phage protein
VITFDLSATPLADSRIVMLKSAAEAAVGGAIARGVDRIAADARGNVAALRDPGRPSPSLLAASITTTLADDGLSGTVGAGSATAPYAPYVEFGTTRAPAQPFLGPALVANAARICEDIAAALGDAL